MQYFRRRAFGVLELFLVVRDLDHLKGRVHQINQTTKCLGDITGG